MADRISPLHNTPRQPRIAEKLGQQRSVVNSASFLPRSLSMESPQKAEKASMPAPAAEPAQMLPPEPPPMPEPIDARPIVLRRGLAVHLTAKDVFEMTTPHPPVKAALKDYQKSTIELSLPKLDVRA